MTDREQCSRRHPDRDARTHTAMEVKQTRLVKPSPGTTVTVLEVDYQCINCGINVTTRFFPQTA